MNARPLVEHGTSLVRDALAAHPGRIVLACSFGGPTGMVLLDLAMRLDRSVPVYYLDTEVLFEETYDLVSRIRERYGIEPVAVRSAFSIAEQNAAYGDALWARDPDACCGLRKVAPQRAFLANYDAWITGLRRDQSTTRREVPFVERDPSAGGILKYAPLADWTEADVWAYVVANDVPYNALNDRGYPSVGCSHCTRAVEPGEDVRAGRWSGSAKVECGIHVSAAPNAGSDERDPVAPT